MNKKNEPRCFNKSRLRPVLKPFLICRLNLILLLMSSSCVKVFGEQDLANSKDITNKVEVPTACSAEHCHNPEVSKTLVTDESQRGSVVRGAGVCQDDGNGEAKCPILSLEEAAVLKEEVEVLSLEEAEVLKEEVEGMTSNFIRRSMEGLEEMLGQVEQSRVKVLEKLGGVMDQVVHSKDQVMKGFDDVMDRVSESVSESKVRVIQGFDSVMDKMAESRTKMMEELDQVIDNLAHSKVMEEIRALPREIRESFVLSVRNQSYVMAGVMVAATTAILIAGVLYYAWCHHDAWNYNIVPIEELPQAAEDVITHIGTKFADGSVVSNGITSCFVSNSASVVRRRKVNAAKVNAAEVNGKDYLKEKGKHSVNETASLLQQTTSGLQQTTSGLQQTTSGLQQTESGLQQTESGLQQTESGLQQTESGLQQTESGLQQTESGLQQKESVLQKTESVLQQTESVLQQTESGPLVSEEDLCQMDEPIQQNVRAPEGQQDEAVSCSSL
ncbi:unnamed protein product [Lymnaea stagnalis]|uniref:Uncharacterized protein n=1 Tax=Lymnaea stagnalis TaxID=6523 RepID=A0AAV2HE33_LYMST